MSLIATFTTPSDDIHYRFVKSLRVSTGDKSVSNCHVMPCPSGHSKIVISVNVFDDLRRMLGQRRVVLDAAGLSEVGTDTVQ